ncbi:hypothetical protein [Aquabacterium sp.]|uniref:hypothetical protein n=1 Tax=Aquabacterium sp. TaxID=1872578 RepID=UPI0019B891F1|nr:hypothetical protein [Aquabacterium sp.]MBC7701471.1 hypothetical protein [Aquabacterium sp.]
MASSFFVDDKASTRTYGVKVQPTLVKLQAMSAAAPVDDSNFPTPSSLRRAQVCPPSLFSRSGPQWQRWVKGFWSWLWDLDEYPEALPVLTGLTKVKSEFIAAMWDLQSVRANHVRDAIEDARSLRELWHLRAEVFRAISTNRGQTEATVRIAALNNHFPVRMSRPATEIRAGRTTTW